MPCGVGYYSSPGQSVCTICPLGHYCGSNTTTNSSLNAAGGLWSNSADPSGICFNGTYCGLGMTRAPDLLRDPCPPGYYCPTGTPYPVSCPSGTYNPSPGQYQLSGCLLTPGAWFCDLLFTFFNCSNLAGYYTTASSTEFSQLCSPGYYCPAGSSGPDEVPCPARYYRPNFGAASAVDCSLCVAGGYCPSASVIPTVCPRGYYCPTGVSIPEPCVPGTYGNSSGLKRVEDCKPCDPGTYCDGTGLTAPRGLCSSGFYCITGSNTSTPNGYGNVSLPSAMGSICPPGYYCPKGSAAPIACPPGTFNSITGATAIAFCVGCTPGYYCEGSGNFKVTGPCSPGYYCNGSAVLPTQYQSLPGYYSGIQAIQMSPCQVGTYNELFAQTNCTICPEGYFCPNQTMTSFVVCPPGNYCPLGSSVTIGCPIGTFSPNVGNKVQSDCSSCSPGLYCSSSGEFNV